jgi:hypothetical protein
MVRVPDRSWTDILRTIGLAGLLLAFPAAAQPSQQAPPANASAQTPSNPDGKSESDSGDEIQEQAASPKNDRLFWTLPNYLTVENAAHVPPLTAGGKFKLTTKDSFDPVAIPHIGLLAGKPGAKQRTIVRTRGRWLWQALRHRLCRQYDQELAGTTPCNARNSIHRA